MKKTNKLWLALLLTVLVAALLAVGLTASAEETPAVVASGYCGGEDDGTNLVWTFDSEGTVVFTGTGKMGTFPSLDGMNDLIVNEGITSISDRMFYDYRFISITLPASLETIGEYAFCHNKTLQTVTIPADGNLTTLGGGAFSTAFHLKGFRVPNGITSIEPYTFNTTEIRYVVIPKSVADIGRGAFQQCDYLKDIYYGGNEEEWNAIVIDTDNESLLNATVHFDAAEHEPGDPVRENVVPATCVTAGNCEVVTYCIHCGCELTRRQQRIEPTGHVHVLSIEKEQPTETRPGHEAGIQCQDCGTYLSGGEDIHNVDGDYIIIKEPTVDETGEIKIECSKCGEWGLYELPKLDPSEVPDEPENPDQPDQPSGDNGGDEDNSIWGRIRRAAKGFIKTLLRLIRWLGGKK